MRLFLVWWGFIVEHCINIGLMPFDKNLDRLLSIETGNGKWVWLHPEAVARDLQWRIQDFPEGATTPEWGANLLFGMISAENCMKMETNWTGDPSFLARPLYPPMDFAKHILWSLCSVCGQTRKGRPVSLHFSFQIRPKFQNATFKQPNGIFNQVCHDVKSYNLTAFVICMFVFVSWHVCYF